MLELKYGELGARSKGAQGSEFAGALAFFRLRVTMSASPECKKAGVEAGLCDQQRAAAAYLQASICFKAAEMPESE